MAFRYLVNPNTKLYCPSGSLLDSSGNAYDFTNSGSATSTPAGRFGSAYSFNGTSNYWTGTNSNDLKQANTFTIGVICNFASTTGLRMLFSNYKYINPNNYGYYCYVFNGTLYWQYWLGATTSIYCTATVTTSVWYLIHLVNTTTEIAIYLNGRKFTPTSTLGNNVAYSTSSFLVGAYDIGAGAINFHSGLIDSIFFENKVMSDSEIKKQFNQNFKPLYT